MILDLICSVKNELTIYVDEELLFKISLRLNMEFFSVRLNYIHH